MAKKVTLENLKIELSELEKKEQTADVMAAVDAKKAEIEAKEKEEKELEAEIEKAAKEKEEKKAQKEREKAEREAAKAPVRKSNLETFEEWQLEKKTVDQKVVFSKLKKIKDTRISQEHADLLNAQKANTLQEYIKKEE